MKLVEAVINRPKQEEVRNALDEIGAEGVLIVFDSSAVFYFWHADKMSG